MTSYDSTMYIFEISFDETSIYDFEKDIQNRKYSYPILEYPVLYILKSNDKIYVGETTNIIKRLIKHSSDAEKKEMPEIFIFSAEYFNQSLVENLEAIIIDIFKSESKYMVINKTSPNVKDFHNYYCKKALLNEASADISTELETIFSNIMFKSNFDKAIGYCDNDKSNPFDTFTIIDFDFNNDSINKNAKESNKYPCVYLLRNEQNLYIGESANILNRLLAHKKDSSKKKFTKVSLITFNQFNNSATYDIETSLLNYCLADEKYIIHNKKQEDTKVVYSYYNQIYYHNDIFQSIWEKLLSRGIVDNEILHLQTKDIFKISPFISLTAAQDEFKEKIISAIKKNPKQKELFIIKGEAGSGKSVLVSSLYNEILSLYATNKQYHKKNYILVNHEEMLKTYQLMSKFLPLMVKSNLLKPTSFINKNSTEENPSHITIIDEGHTLLSSPDNYNNFRFDNHLEEIIKRSTKVILIFDEKQFLKLKSFWSNNKLEQLVKKMNIEVHEKKLASQLRMVCSREIIQWLDLIVEEKIIKELPPVDPNFELTIFDDCLSMYNKIQEKNEESKLSRLVATFDYVHKKDGKEYYIKEGTVELPWNIITSEAWAQREQTLHQIGSIYTIQGFDLNYAGVILGPSLSYNFDTNRLVVDITKYQDSGAFSIPRIMKNDFSREEIEDIKERIILNSLNVLIKRPIKGLYLYASDEKLRAHLSTLKRTK